MVATGPADLSGHGSRFSTFGNSLPKTNDVKSSGEFLENILLYKVLSKNLPPKYLGPKLSMMNN